MKPIIIVMILSLLFCSLIGIVKITNAQTSTIVISPDGSVNPSYGIQKDGNIYTLTADLNLPIKIQKSNIILNGANHTLQGTGRNNSLAAISLTASNITVINCNITNWEAGIYGAYNNNTITANQFTNNTRAITLYATDYIINKNIIQQNGDGIYIKTDCLTCTGDNNLIINNQIVSNSRAFNIINSDGTTITKNNVTGNKEILALGNKIGVPDFGNHLLYLNNFINNSVVLYVHIPGPFVSGLVTISPAGTWDNGTAGNYWSDYNTKYPNASERGDSGIGDMSYVIESDPISWSTGSAEGVTVLGSGVDCYPLIDIYNIFDTVESPDSSDASDPLNNISVECIVVSVFVFSILAIVLIAAIYRRKRRQT